MANSNADNVRALELVSGFTEELKQRSIKLYAERVEAIESFYGGIFDGRPDCAEIIGMPNDGRCDSPSTYMAYREARFVLDSDASQNDVLAADWAALHAKIQHEMDPQLLTGMAKLNTCARWHIIKCQDRLTDLAPKLATLVKAGLFDEATSLFNDELAFVDRTFDGIIAHYLQPALSPSS